LRSGSRRASRQRLRAFGGIVSVETSVDRARRGPPMTTVIAFRDRTCLRPLEQQHRPARAGVEVRRVHRRARARGVRLAAAVPRERDCRRSSAGLPDPPPPAGRRSSGRALRGGRAARGPGRPAPPPRGRRGWQRPGRPGRPGRAGPSGGGGARAPTAKALRSARGGAARGCSGDPRPPRTHRRRIGGDGDARRRRG
jgi:hypothetical protein